MENKLGNSREFVRTRTRPGIAVEGPPTPEQRLQNINKAIKAIMIDDPSTVVSCIPGNIEVGNLYNLVLGVDLGKPRKVSATLLHLALHHRAVQCAKLLLHLGAPTEASESDLGDRAIHSAVRMGSLELVNLVVEYGASVMSTNAFEETPLHLAAEKGLVHVVKTLLEAGADPVARNRYQETCWDSAVLSGTPSTLMCADLILNRYLQGRNNEVEDEDF